MKVKVPPYDISHDALVFLRPPFVEHENGVYGVDYVTSRSRLLAGTNGILRSSGFEQLPDYENPIGWLTGSV